MVLTRTRYCEYLGHTGIEQAVAERGKREKKDQMQPERPRPAERDADQGF